MVHLVLSHLLRWRQVCQVCQVRIFKIQKTCMWLFQRKARFRASVVFATLSNKLTSTGKYSDSSKHAGKTYQFRRLKVCVFDVQRSACCRAEKYCCHSKGNSTLPPPQHLRTPLLSQRLVSRRLFRGQKVPARPSV